jgi:hypothetical protein
LCLKNKRDTAKYGKQHNKLFFSNKQTFSNSTYYLGWKRKQFF